MLASKLPEGLWAAQCRNWEVLLDGNNGRWSATIVLTPTHPMMPVRRAVHVGQMGFTSPQDAAKWATDKLKDHGIAVFLLSSDGEPPKTLLDYLDFAPVAS
jgi:hypothetical protein